MSPTTAPAMMDPARTVALPLVSVISGQASRFSGVPSWMTRSTPRRSVSWADSRQAAGWEAVVSGAVWSGWRSVAHRGRNGFAG